MWLNYNILPIILFFLIASPCAHCWFELKYAQSVTLASASWIKCGGQSNLLCVVHSHCAKPFHLAHKMQGHLLLVLSWAIGWDCAHYYRHSLYQTQRVPDSLTKNLSVLLFSLSQLYSLHQNIVNAKNLETFSNVSIFGSVNVYAKCCLFLKTCFSYVCAISASKFVICVRKLPSHPDVGSWTRYTIEHTLYSEIHLLQVCIF